MTGELLFDAIATGSLNITNANGTCQLSTGTITLQLASLASVDSVAGYNVAESLRGNPEVFKLDRRPG